MAEKSVKRDIRYQGAVVREYSVLLIQHRVHATGMGHWLLPGGGREGEETEERCVEREMYEETCLHVVVGRLLLDEPSPSDRVYQRKKTYLCRAVDGVAAPGYEPEPEIQAKYAISAVRWLDLQSPPTWGDEIILNEKTYPELLRIREALGYATEPGLARDRHPALTGGETNDPTL